MPTDLVPLGGREVALVAALALMACQSAVADQHGDSGANIADAGVTRDSTAGGSFGDSGSPRSDASDSGGGVHDAGAACVRVGDTCKARSPDVYCCPQEGYAYDFSAQCFDTKRQLVFCFESNSTLRCGHTGVLSCYERRDDAGQPEAWFTENGWTGTPTHSGFGPCSLPGRTAPGDFLKTPYCGDGGGPVGSSPLP